MGIYEWWYANYWQLYVHVLDSIEVPSECLCTGAFVVTDKWLSHIFCCRYPICAFCTKNGFPWSRTRNYAIRWMGSLGKMDRANTTFGVWPKPLWYKRTILPDMYVFIMPITVKQPYDRQLFEIFGIMMNQMRHSCIHCYIHSCCIMV